MLKNIKLIVSYSGSSYLGWQKTKMGQSVESVLEGALAKVLQQEVKLQAASRTDAGVHALAQVVTFHLKKEFSFKDLKFRLNCYLPKDIVILDVSQVPIDFHPTLNALKKEYIYQICNGSIQLPFHRHISWHFPYPLDLDLMRHESTYLLGTHDFSCLCNERKLWDRNPVCNVEKIEIIAMEEKRLMITIVCDHFLFRMARNLVGTLVYIGCGKLKPGILPAMIQSKDRTWAGMTAPAHALALKEVFYDFAQ